MTAVPPILRTAGRGNFTRPVPLQMALIMKWSRFPWQRFVASWLVLGTLFLVGSACGGDGGGPGGPSGTGTLTAQVDGSGWTATSGILASRQNNVVAITGSVGSISSIAIGWPDEGLGTYSIPLAAGMNLNYGLYSNGHLWQALAMGAQLGGVGSGSVTVTTLNGERVVGTFQFTAPAAASSGASGQKVVTNGAFNIKF